MFELTIGQLAGGGAALLAVLATIVQIAPIKINPWSAVARAIGRAINKEVIEAQKELAAKFDNHVKVDEEKDIKLARVRVLRFNDELLRDVRHTKEHFDEILEDIDEYEQYCREHPDFKNNRAVLAIENIKSTYRHLVETRGFLGFLREGL